MSRARARRAPSRSCRWVSFDESRRPFRGVRTCVLETKSSTLRRRRRVRALFPGWLIGGVVPRAGSCLPPTRECLRRTSTGSGRGAVPPAGLSARRRGRRVAAPSFHGPAVGRGRARIRRKADRGGRARDVPELVEARRRVAGRVGCGVRRRPPRVSTRRQGPTPPAGFRGSALPTPAAGGVDGREVMSASSGEGSRAGVVGAGRVARRDRGLSRYHRARREGRRGRSADGAPAGSPRRGGTSSTVARRFAGGGFWGSSRAERRVAVTTARPSQPRAYVPPQTLDELPRAHGPVGVGSSPRAEGGEVDHGGVRRDCRGRRRRPPAQIYEDRSVSPVRRVPVHCCLSSSQEIPPRAFKPPLAVALQTF